MEQHINAKNAAELFDISVAIIYIWEKKQWIKSVGKNNFVKLYNLTDIEKIATRRTRCRVCDIKLTDENKYGVGKHGYICKICKNNFEKENSARRRKNNPKETNDAVRKSKRKTKQAVFSHYCNGDIRCARCKINDMRVLSIDHINGGGAKQKKELGGAGDRIYCWLKKHNYPTGFQILCMNCQFIKRYENNEHN